VTSKLAVFAGKNFKPDLTFLERKAYEIQSDWEVVDHKLASSSHPFPLTLPSNIYPIVRIIENDSFVVKFGA
jgi:hypothetical protein